MSAKLAFSDASKAQIQQLLGRYRDRRAALIPALWVAQRQFGWLSTDAMQLVAAQLDIPEAWVYSTATFYTMFHKRPVGKTHIQICTNIACYLRGADDLMDVVKQELGIGHGETTQDGQFTCESVQCLAACGYAPALQINEDDHFNVSAEQMRQLIADSQGDGAPPPPSAAPDEPPPPPPAEPSAGGQDA